MVLGINTSDDKALTRQLLKDKGVTCPNLHVDEVANVFEVNQNFPDTMMYIRKIRETPKARIIRVYDLKDYFEPQTDNPRPIP